MASETRRPTPALKAELFGEPQAYSFFQLVRLLRWFAGDQVVGSTDALFRDRLRFRPALSLGFPATDVLSLLQEKPTDRVEVLTSFLGLYGVSSPLPTHYTEELFDEQRDDGTVTREFLDLLNEPFFRLFFQCWSKHRLAFRVAEEGDRETTQRLFCLGGFGIPQRGANDQWLLRYLGLFTQFPRSAAGLGALLSDALGLDDLTIDQCVPRKIAIDESLRCRVGQRCTALGVDCHLGEQMDDRMGAIRIIAGSLDADAFYALQPRAPLYAKLIELVKLYLDRPLQVELELVLRPQVVRTPVLGERRGTCLGRDCWVFSGNALPGEARVGLACEETTPRGEP